MLRQRNLGLKNIKSLDAFPKVPNDYKTHSAVGGTFSLLSFCAIVYLIFAETWYYLDSKLQFKFEPDTDYEGQLQMNIDITIAMPCSKLGADVVDTTYHNLMTSDTLHEEDTWWELSPEQRAHFDAFKHINVYFREEYHAIHELLWKSNQLTFSNEMPKRTSKPTTPPNACRIYGSLKINKVAGNFHITAGKSLTLPRGHVHISSFMSEKNYNFTHRINKFSFGKPSPGIIHPLEGDEKVATEHMMLYQYFVEAVPTDIKMLIHKSKTYQYSVKEHQRPINHNKGSHGLPGVFFKYDMCALKVKITQERESLFQFLVKLCATVGGVVVTNNLLNRIIQNFWYILCCKFLHSAKMTSEEKIIVNDSGVKKEKLGKVTLLPQTNLLVQPK